MRKAPLTVCVVGGGFTGAAAAIACFVHLDQPFRLVVAEPSPSLGRGVAYGAHHPLHLLNVRTRDLSIRAGQPGDFLNWAFRQLDQGENHAGLHDGLGHTFLPRQLFGEYVRQRFFEAVEARADVELKLVNAVATACSTEGGCYLVHFDRAEPVAADIVLLATAYGLQSPSGDGALAPFEILPRDRLTSAKSMVLIGSGLTMTDDSVERAARRVPGQGHGDLAARTIAAAACIERRRAATDRSAALEARVGADLGGRHRLRGGGSLWHAVAGHHERGSAPRCRTFGGAWRLRSKHASCATSAPSGTRTAIACQSRCMGV